MNAVALMLALSCAGRRVGESIDLGEFHDLVDSGDPVVVDVRTPGEYAQGHIPGALHIPLGELPARLGELDAHRAEPVYLVCSAGVRSASARAILLEAGFAHPVNVTAGTWGWRAAGYPIESAPGPYGPAQE